jgi:hypothetical protein
MTREVVVTKRAGLVAPARVCSFARLYFAVRPVDAKSENRRPLWGCGILVKLAETTEGGRDGNGDTSRERLRSIYVLGDGFATTKGPRARTMASLSARACYFGVGNAIVSRIKWRSDLGDAILSTVQSLYYSKAQYKTPL